MKVFFPRIKADIREFLQTFNDNSEFEQASDMNTAFTKVKPTFSKMNKKLLMK
jgi:hypothetical protein